MTKNLRSPSREYATGVCGERPVSDTLKGSTIGPGGGMADTEDSKSSARKGVWVQIPPGALCRSCEFATHPASLMRRLGRR